MRRVKTENMSLLTALDKTERLVYKTNGVVISSGAIHPGKENAYSQATQPYRYPWEKETDNAMRSTWHSSNPTSSNNHNSYPTNMGDLLSGYDKHQQQRHVGESNTTRGQPPSLSTNRRLHRANAMASLATRGTVSSNARAMSVSSMQATNTLI